MLGGGNSGLEEGLFLPQFVDKVTIVQRGDRLAANKLLQDKVHGPRQMEVLLNREVVEFRAKEDGAASSARSCSKDRERVRPRSCIPPACFVFIGLDPNTGFVKGSVDLDERGLIVDRHGSHDEHAGRVRGRGRALGLDQAARLGGRRGRGGRDRDPAVPRGPEAKPVHMV